MKSSELVYIGIRGSVVALNRSNGGQVWVTRLKGYDFANVVLDGDKLFVTAHGEIFCLDPLSGGILWHNKLTGFGIGLATIATGNTNQASVFAERTRQEQSQASAAAVVPVMG